MRIGSDGSAGGLPVTPPDHWGIVPQSTPRSLVRLSTAGVARQRDALISLDITVSFGDPI